MTPTRRGLRDIHTLTGRVGKVTAPYKAYMRISHLELERARRNRERQGARQLIANIDNRLQEIDQEKLKILEAMRDGHFEEAPPASRRAGLPKSFKIRY
jgi:hypothetical protein